MLFLVFGSSAAGKTSALSTLRGRIDRLAIHDFDEIGVPVGADTVWRHRANERWIRRALGYQAEGADMLLAGPAPYGEVLASPSAPELEGVAGCLVDCDDETRLERMRARGADWLARAGGTLDDYLAWAAWMRGHARDPQWRTDVIRVEATEHELVWSRWSDWQAGDPRWRIRVIDTSASTVAQTAQHLADWIAEERARR